jgi:hypothetical protein
MHDLFLQPPSPRHLDLGAQKKSTKHPSTISAKEHRGGLERIDVLAFPSRLLTHLEIVS